MWHTYAVFLFLIRSIRNTLSSSEAFPADDNLLSQPSNSSNTIRPKLLFLKALLLSHIHVASCFTNSTMGTFSRLYSVFRAQADWTSTHTSHKDTEHSAIEASVTLDGVTLTQWSGDLRMNDLQLAWRYQCLPVRCSGRLIGLHNEYSIYIYLYVFYIIYIIIVLVWNIWRKFYPGSEHFSTIIWNDFPQNRWHQDNLFERCYQN
jgi:hypothetical protein